MEKAKPQTKRQFFLRTRRIEPEAKGETHSKESFLRKPREKQGSQLKDERQLVESHILRPNQPVPGAGTGTQADLFGDDMNQPRRRLDPKTLAAHYKQSKFNMLASAAAVLSSTGPGLQQEHLPNSATMYSQDSFVSSISDAAAFKNKEMSKRKRAEQRQMRPQQQMARYEIVLDDPFMTNSVNIGTDPVNNYLSNNHHWGWEHHNWN